MIINFYSFYLFIIVIVVVDIDSLSNDTHTHTQEGKSSQDIRQEYIRRREVDDDVMMMKVT